MDESPVKVVKKALDALDFLVEVSLEKRGVGLGEIAERVAVQPTTIRNILKTMEQCGYVSRIEGRLYVPGCKCQGMIRASILTGSNSDYIEDEMRSLAQSTGESVVLATLLAGNRRVLMRVESGEIIRVDSKSAEMSSFWSLVTTRVLMAYASPDEIDMALNIHGMPGNAWAKVNNRQDLMQELRVIRNDGYIEDEPTPDTFAIALPVLHSTSGLLACIGLYMPKFRLSKERRLELLENLQFTAKSISQMEEYYGR